MPESDKSVAKLKMLRLLTQRTNNSLILRLLTLCSAGILFSIAVLFLPERFIIAFMLLFFLSMLLIFLSKSDTFKSQQTASIVARDYELAKRRWKKELEDQDNPMPYIPYRKANPRKQKGIIPDSFSPQNSSGILKLTQRSKKVELEHQASKTRLSNEINDQILEKRIRNEFLRIKNADPVQYRNGINKIRKLLNLRSKRLIC